MYSEMSEVMWGNRARIFALGAAIEDWSRILPHYRAVELSDRSEGPDGTVRKVATMKAWRIFPGFAGFAGVKMPVFWRTLQYVNAERELLHFYHIGGFTRGMDVYWRFTDAAERGATRVTITHEWDLRWPFVGEAVAHRIVGDQFVDAIARRTLRTIQGIVEDEAATAATATGTTDTHATTGTGATGA